MARLDGRAPRLRSAGAAEDDAFGKDWAPLDPIAGAELWRELSRTPAPPTLGLALSAIAAEWTLPLAPFATPTIHPSTRLVASGPSAVAALAEAFEGRADLAWADQVAVVATDPGARQLAAFCGAALGVTKPALLSARRRSARPRAPPLRRRARRRSRVG